MPKLLKRPPKYRLHKSTGQAVVSVHGKVIQLGPFGSPRSHERYQQEVERWRDGLSQQYPDRAEVEPEPIEISIKELQGRRRRGFPMTINEIALLYEDYAHGYYVKNGKVTLQHAPEIVADMVRFQRLTGTRPGEVCTLRPCDIDRTEEVWVAPRGRRCCGGWSLRPATQVHTIGNSVQRVTSRVRSRSSVLAAMLRDLVLSFLFFVREARCVGRDLGPLSKPMLNPLASPAASFFAATSVAFLTLLGTPTSGGDEADRDRATRPTIRLAQENTRIATGVDCRIVINANMAHEVGGVSTFDRSKFITIHSTVTDEDWGNSSRKKGLSPEDAKLRDDFFEEYDVYLGRDNGAFPWHLNRLENTAERGRISEKHARALGKRDREQYASVYRSNPASYRRLERRSAHKLMGGQPQMYPQQELRLSCEQEHCDRTNEWLSGFDALAEFYATNLTYSFGTGGATGRLKPTLVEVMNEPILFAGRHRTTPRGISELHSVVAKKIKAEHPEVKVGGYTAAWPALEERGFATFDERWKVFIDVAGKDMDFYSIHIYDSFRGKKDAYRAGANTDAILDMLDQYSLLATGEAKPWVISEYGYFTPDVIERESIRRVGYSRELDWLNVRSFSSMLMGLLERPDQIVSAIPFHLNKALWHEAANGGVNDKTGKRYGTRLFVMEDELEGDKHVREKPDSEWVYSDIVKWYQLWSDVKGTRVDSYSDEIDIQVDGYVDGSTLYVILNNMELTDQTVALNIARAAGQRVEGVEGKQLYWHEGKQRSVLYRGKLATDLDKIAIKAEATAILKVTFAEDVPIREKMKETKYYADSAGSFRQAIVADQPITMEIPRVKTNARFGEAVLRLGLGRKHDRSLLPKVSLNGVVLRVPTDVRGHYENKARDDFFGIIEIPAPYSALERTNRVQVTFPDTGGTVTTAVLQVFEMSSNARGIR